MDMGDPDADIDYPVDKVSIAMFDLAEDDGVYEWYATADDATYEPTGTAVVVLIDVNKMPTGDDIYTFGMHLDGFEESPLAVWKESGVYTTWFADANMLKKGLLSQAPVFIGDDEDVQTMPDGWEGPQGLGNLWGYDVKVEENQLKLFGYGNAGRTYDWELDEYHAHMWIFKSDTNEWITFHDDYDFADLGGARLVTAAIAFALYSLF